MTIYFTELQPMLEVEYDESEEGIHLRTYFNEDKMCDANVFLNWKALGHLSHFLDTKTSHNFWIDVKDKLPRKNEKVLFQCIQDDCLKNVFMGYLSDGGWNIYLPYHSFALNSDVMVVTHWMPLPAFPKD